MKKEAPKNGPRTEYHKNGQKLTEENYKDDKMDGTWTYWNQDGQTKEVRNYKDGKCISGDCPN